MRKLIVGLVVVAALGLAGQARAEGKRFNGCAIANSGTQKCTHTVIGSDVFTFQFTDTRDAKTPYVICIKDIVGKQCFRAKTGKAGAPDDFFYEARASGDHTIRWKVDGHQVERWDFELFPEPQ